MTYNFHWFHDHHWDFSFYHLHFTAIAAWLKSMWVGVLIVLLGIVALVSAVNIAYPVLVHIAAKFFQ